MRSSVNIKMLIRAVCLGELMMNMIVIWYNVVTHLLNTHLLYGTRTPKILIIILKKCKKRAAHFVCGDFTSRSEVCVSNMTLDWDSLANRPKIHRLTEFQQAHQGHLSLPVETLQPVQRHSWHLHANAYNIISTNKDCMKYSFILPKNYHRLELTLRTHHQHIISIPQFKQALINLREMTKAY